MLEYIVNDFENARIAIGDNDIGGMVVCDSSEQAREMYKIFLEKYGKTNPVVNKIHSRVSTAALILHDEEDKDTRREVVKSFRGKIDFLLFITCFSQASMQNV